MREAYPIFILRDEEDYLVYAPDFDIYTEGKSVGDAMKMARDAIGLKGLTYKDNGLEVPSSSTYEEARKKAAEESDEIDFNKGFLTFVDIDFEKYYKRFGSQIKLF